MALRMIDHPILLVPFFLLTVSFLIGGRTGWVLMGLSFWLIVYLSFTSDARIEGKKLVIRIGRPVTVARKEIPIDEIVEVIELPSVGGIRLLEQFQRPWVPIGITAIGISIGVLFLVRGEFYGLLWVYISIISSLNYLFRPKDRKGRVLVSTVISLAAAVAFLFLGYPELTLGIILYGLFDALFANDNYGQDALIVRTESERIVLIGDSAGEMLEKLKSLLSGGSNVQAS
ncbi:hypothetical protein [Thermococcus sp.]